MSLQAIAWSSNNADRSEQMEYSQQALTRTRLQSPILVTKLHLPVVRAAIARPQLIQRWDVPVTVEPVILGATDLIL